MDPELRTLLRALTNGQVKLFEAQSKTSREVRGLAAGQRRLFEAQARMSKEFRLLGARLDRFSRAVIRGFANGAARHHATQVRLDQIERRVTKIEKR